VENVVGCLLLAALLVVLLEVTRPHRYLRPFLGVGVLGGFTTFSAYTQDARALLLAGEGGLAGLYLGGTLLAGLLATWAGLVLARTAATTLSRRST
jgi:CrcB protein